MSIDQAVQILRRGGLVAFPTETVYGLGADATNPDAVRKIFAAKGRPPTNPIIVHVADKQRARRYAAEWPANAELLAGEFWPGPLTIVLRKSPAIVPETSAGRDTVGLRAPDHPMALDLLRAFDGPIAAPSANRSTRISPTTADHVRDELGSAVELILDGGPCRVGIESTVLDLSGNTPTILRPGSITQRQIETLIGPVNVFQGSVDLKKSAASPGQHAIHYSPRAVAYRFTADHAAQVAEACESTPPESRALLYFGSIPQILTVIPFRWILNLPLDAGEASRNLYAALRRLDEPDIESIWVQMPPETPEWIAVRDRLLRATREMHVQGE